MSEERSVEKTVSERDELVAYRAHSVGGVTDVRGIYFDVKAFSPGDAYLAFGVVKTMTDLDIEETVAMTTTADAAEHFILDQGQRGLTSYEMLTRVFVLLADGGFLDVTTLIGSKPVPFHGDTENTARARALSKLSVAEKELLGLAEKDEDEAEK